MADAIQMADGLLLSETRVVRVVIGIGVIALADLYLG
jgi:hypothetical protein